MIYITIKQLAKIAVYFDSVKAQVALEARLRVLGRHATAVEEQMLAMIEAYNATEQEIQGLKNAENTRENRDLAKTKKAELAKNENEGKHKAKMLDEIGRAIEKTKAEIKNEKDKRANI